MSGSAARTSVGLVSGCLLLGFLYVESSRLSHEVHHEYQRRIEMIGAIDARINQDVLRAGAGLLRNYDELVQDQSEIEDSIESIRIAPEYFDEADRTAYEAALARLAEQVDRKGESTERFKSSHAAVRGSVLYLPEVLRRLLDKVESGVSDAEEEIRIRKDVRRVVGYLVSGSEAAHGAAQIALRDFEALAADSPAWVDDSVWAAIVMHTRNILDRKPELDLLIPSVVSAPTRAALDELRHVYRVGHARAAMRADQFERALYICSVLMLILLGSGMRRLTRARTRLAELNAHLEDRVRERTLELTQVKEKLEAESLAIQAVNEKLETSYRELEETRLEQIKVRDNFLSHVSHELRSPLTAIHQFISLILDGLAGEVSDEQREYLEISFRNVNQLTRMIADLMEVTRAKSGKLRLECHPVDLVPLIDEAVLTGKAKALERSISLVACPGEGLPPALVDEARIRQVLNNLVENAIKFTPAGGTIEIESKHDEGNRVLQVSVRDTGVGIAPGSLELVFEQLHQEPAAETKSRKGLGIGLAICKELVERQGGRIWVESREGEGSTFHFTLPEFRLGELLTSVVRTDRGLCDELALICVDLRLRGDENVDESLRRHVRHELQGLVYGKSDVLLPRIDWAADRERFWLAAATGAVGAEAISARISERMTSGEKLENEDVVLVVENFVFDLNGSLRDESELTKWVGSIVRMIHDNKEMENNKWSHRKSSSSTTTQTSDSA